MTGDPTCIAHDQGCMTARPSRSEEKKAYEGGWGKWQRSRGKNEGEDAHLALKILHNIQKVVVHVRLVTELHLDRVQVAQRVSHVQRSIIAVAVALSRVGSGGGSSRSPVPRAVFRRNGLGLGGRGARARARLRAVERVVRTQPQRLRLWRRLSELCRVLSSASSTICRLLAAARALDFVRGRSRPRGARKGSRLVGACDGKRLGG